MKSYSKIALIAYAVLLFFVFVTFGLPLLMLIYDIIIVTGFNINWQVFGQLLSNTCIISLSIPITIVIAIPISFCIYLNKHKFKFSLFALLSLYVLPCALVGKILYLLFAYDGPIHTLISAFVVELDKVDWLSSLPFSYGVIIFSIILVSIAECVIYIVIGLNRVPINVIEAAQCDGASYLKIISRILIPNIKDVLAIYSLTLLSWIATSSYSLIKQITGGGPGLNTTTYDFYIIRHYFNVSGAWGEKTANSFSLVLFAIYMTIGLSIILTKAIVNREKKK